MNELVTKYKELARFSAKKAWGKSAPLGVGGLFFGGLVAAFMLWPLNKEVFVVGIAVLCSLLAMLSAYIWELESCLDVYYNEIAFRSEDSFLDFLKGPYKVQVRQVLIDWRRRKVVHNHQIYVLREFTIMLANLAQIHGTNLENLNNYISTTICNTELDEFGDYKSPPTLEVNVLKNMEVIITVGGNNTTTAGRASPAGYGIQLDVTNAKSKLLEAKNAGK